MTWRLGVRLQAQLERQREEEAARQAEADARAREEEARLRKLAEEQAARAAEAEECVVGHVRTAEALMLVVRWWWQLLPRRPFVAGLAMGWALLRLVISSGFTPLRICASLSAAAGV